MDANRVGAQLPNRFGGILLGQLIAANMNSTGDQQITIFSAPAKYIIRRIVATNASVDLTTAAGGIYTAAGKSGTTIVAAGQAYTTLADDTKFLDLTLNANTDYRTSPVLFLSLTTPQGAAATADFFVYGDIVAL